MRRYQGLVYNVARQWYELSREDAEEVLQESLIALLNGLNDIHPQALKSWLIRTAVNQSKNQWRRRQRKSRLHKSFSQHTENRAPHNEEDLLEMALVERAVAELDSECREILQLRYFKNPPCSYEEIARRLGLAIGSVGPKRARCLKQVMVLVRKEMSDGELTAKAAG